MARTETVAELPGSPPPVGRTPTELLAWVFRLLVSLIVPLVAFFVLYQGFLFLRDSDAPKLVIALVAIVWGVGGVALLFVLSNWLVERLPDVWRLRIQPFVFIGPGIIMLSWFLAVPVVRTLYQSFFDRTSTNFIGFANYAYAFTAPSMQESFRNNVLWMIVGTGLSVIFGLLIAVLADRSSFESIAKALIFLPMAISFVGAGIIWKFVYALSPGDEQIGLLNAIVAGLGGEPQGWLVERPWNNFFLIIIMVWLQTGFAMVLLSAALKGVPGELLEAARIDGANEFQIFFRIIIPTIQGTIVTVATTILIATLKIFDIVFVMTNGNFGTEVMASQQYKQMFRFQDFGRGSAVAIILLIAVIPVMIYNLRQFRERRAF
ncbi:MAG TPA: sugar ABC transporter permease [Chloroflexia bacterium]|jgi:alpha-glucoside transport system permease protein|nr:sugar ABC transporter permease [Chloroflexia bacterium]